MLTASFWLPSPLWGEGGQTNPVVSIATIRNFAGPRE